MRCEASGVLVAKDKAVRRFVVRAPCAERLRPAPQNNPCLQQLN